MADEAARVAESVAPEINAGCCADMELEAFQDCDDPLVWEVHCVQCNTMAVYIHDRGPLAGALTDGLADDPFAAGFQVPGERTDES